jgi:hypothetical protein
MVGGGEAIRRQGGVSSSVCCCDEPCHSAPLPRPRGRDREGAGKFENAMVVDVPKTPAWQVSTKQRSRARRLRRDMTDAERII